MEYDLKRDLHNLNRIGKNIKCVATNLIYDLKQYTASLMIYFDLILFFDETGLKRAYFTEISYSAGFW